ncbi:hypothetical protein KIH31_08475 [Paenarthrobacter sp. DKR-5]|uniref:hypothetical protein n=1 Tax=Paenarthrobacter sp. DKR-5 TaxID=2835535 RepID=UPI001BDCDE30|nr:hypothetical protein [Paenarthrobacter sp. DKR-5]MBT1002636.1 hypothetical protein [Paenarthrobacter sp. DKR-5]
MAATTNATNTQISFLTVPIKVLDIAGERLTKRIYWQLDYVPAEKWEHFEPIGRVNGIDTGHFFSLCLVGLWKPTGELCRLHLHSTRHPILGKPEDPSHTDPILAALYDEYARLPLIILGSNK